MSQSTHVVYIKRKAKLPKTQTPTPNHTIRIPPDLEQIEIQDNPYLQILSKAILSIQNLPLSTLTYPHYIQIWFVVFLWEVCGGLWWFAVVCGISTDRSHPETKIQRCVAVTIVVAGPARDKDPELRWFDLSKLETSRTEM